MYQIVLTAEFIRSLHDATRPSRPAEPARACAARRAPAFPRAAADCVRAPLAPALCGAGAR